MPWPGRAGPVFRLDRQKAGMYVCIVLVSWLLVLHEQLSWNFDTNMTATKANTARAFISRNIHSCFKKVKAACYTTLVRPMMEYATFALAPHTVHCGGLRISGWIGQLTCLKIFSTSLSASAFFRRAGGSMLESTGSHGRGVERRVPETRRMVEFNCTTT